MLRMEISSMMCHHSVSRRPPVVSGPEAKVEVCSELGLRPRGDRFVRVTLNRYLVRFLWLQTISEGWS